jgi:hypothetical protein
MSRQFFGRSVVSANVNELRLLARFGDVARAGASTRDIAKRPLRGDAVFLIRSETGTRGKTSQRVEG